MDTTLIAFIQKLLGELDQANFAYEDARQQSQNLQRYASVSVMSVLFRTLAPLGDLHFDPESKVYHITIQRGMDTYEIRAVGYTVARGEANVVTF